MLKTNYPSFETETQTAGEAPAVDRRQFIGLAFAGAAFIATEVLVSGCSDSTPSGPAETTTSVEQDPATYYSSAERKERLNDQMDTTIKRTRAAFADDRFGKGQFQPGSAIYSNRDQVEGWGFLEWNLVPEGLTVSLDVWGNKETGVVDLNRGISGVHLSDSVGSVDYWRQDDRDEPVNGELPHYNPPKISASNITSSKGSNPEVIDPSTTYATADLKRIENEAQQQADRILLLLGA